MVLRWPSEEIFPGSFRTFLSLTNHVYLRHCRLAWRSRHQRQAALPCWRRRQEPVLTSQEWPENSLKESEGTVAPCSPPGSHGLHSPWQLGRRYLSAFFEMPRGTPFLRLQTPSLLRSVKTPEISLWSMFGWSVLCSMSAHC